MAPACLAPTTKIANVEDEGVRKQRGFGCALVEFDLQVINTGEVGAASCGWIWAVSADGRVGSEQCPPLLGEVSQWRSLQRSHVRGYWGPCWWPRWGHR